MPSGSAAATVNPLVADIGTPPIPEAQAWMGRYGGAHGPLINMSQAVPGYPPHPELLDRLAQAAAGVDASRYGLIDGDEIFRTAYAPYLSSLYGGAVGADEIAVTAGCNLAFFASLMLVAKAGDNAILPVPWFFNHQMSMDMLGIEPRGLACHAGQGFVPDPEEAERLVDERTRAIVLVSPNNPTGAIYPEAVLSAFRDLCRQRGLWLIIDETYRDFLPPVRNRPHGLFAEDDWREGVIGLYSFSKAYSIPGHRLGSITADAPLIRQLTKILDCIQICAPRAGQQALAWAIEGLRDWREANRLEMHRRAEAFSAALAGSGDWRLDSIGAYFAYVRHPFEGVSSAQVAERLAVERGVLSLPGAYFGAGQDGHLRMAFGNIDREGIDRLVSRLKDFAL